MKITIKLTHAIDPVTTDSIVEDSHGITYWTGSAHRFVPWSSVEWVETEKPGAGDERITGSD